MGYKEDQKLTINLGVGHVSARVPLDDFVKALLPEVAHVTTVFFDAAGMQALITVVDHEGKVYCDLQVDLRLLRVDGTTQFHN
jgi:hypothetical protein